LSSVFCRPIHGTSNSLNRLVFRPEVRARFRAHARCARRMRSMSDTAIVGENVEVIQAGTGTNTPFSWSAAIAGAFAATAVAFIIISLGTGIGLPLSSPYSAGPSLKTLTILGAVWLVRAHTFAFAPGGYLAGR